LKFKILFQKIIGPKIPRHIQANTHTVQVKGFLGLFSQSNKAKAKHFKRKFRQKSAPINDVLVIELNRTLGTIQGPVFSSSFRLQAPSSRVRLQVGMSPRRSTIVAGYAKWFCGLICCFRCALPFMPHLHLHPLLPASCVNRWRELLLLLQLDSIVPATHCRGLWMAFNEQRRLL